MSKSILGWRIGQILNDVADCAVKDFTKRLQRIGGNRFVRLDPANGGTADLTLDLQGICRRAAFLPKREDGKWQLFITGSDKVIKTFATKAEGEKYAKEKSANTGRAVLAHNSKGANKGKIKKK